MKNLLVIIAILFVNSSFAQIPDKVNLNEDLINIVGTDFSANADIKVKEKSLSIGRYFTLYQNKKVLATAKQRPVTIGTKIDVYDHNENKIAFIEEKLFHSFGFYSIYKIYDHNDNLMATSEKHKYLATKFTLKDNKGKTLCVITRPAINLLQDRWTINYKSNSLDKRIALFIPCFKTAHDNSK